MEKQSLAGVHTALQEPSVSQVCSQDSSQGIVIVTKYMLEGSCYKREELPVPDRRQEQVLEAVSMLAWKCMDNAIN